MFCRYCGQKIEDDSVFCSSCGKTLGGAAPESNTCRENAYEAVTRESNTYEAAPNGINAHEANTYQASTHRANVFSGQTDIVSFLRARMANRPIWRTLYIVVFCLWVLSAILMCVDWISVELFGYSISANVFTVLEINDELAVAEEYFEDGNPFEKIAATINGGLIVAVLLVAASIILFVKENEICCLTGIAASAVMLWFSAGTLNAVGKLPFSYGLFIKISSAPTILLIVNIVAVILLIISFLKNPGSISAKFKNLLTKFSSDIGLTKN